MFAQERREESYFSQLPQLAMRPHQMAIRHLELANVPKVWNTQFIRIYMDNYFLAFI